MDSLLQQKYERLLLRVARMRAAQKTFEMYRAEVDRKAKRRLEWEVDRIIKEELKERKSNQIKLL